MKAETVKVKSGKSFVIINKSDFDEKKHNLYKEPKAKASNSEDNE